MTANATSHATEEPIADSPRARLSRRARNSLLTAHIVVSVGLLGDSAGFLAVAVRSAVSDDPAMKDSARELLGMFALLFGIPVEDSHHADGFDRVR